MLKKITSSGLKWLWIALVVIIVDRASKYWVIHHLHFFEPFKLLPFFNLTLAYNTGAAFSFLHSASGWQNWIFSSLAIIVSVVLLASLARLPSRSRWLSIAFCLIIAGAIGNVWDRMLYGYVIDFLDFHIRDWHFAIFNIADSAICVGAAILFWDWIK